VQTLALTHSGLEPPGKTRMIGAAGVDSTSFEARAQDLATGRSPI